MIIGMNKRPRYRRKKDVIPTMSLIGRLGEPKEVAYGSLFLCSDHVSYSSWNCSSCRRWI